MEFSALRGSVEQAFPTVAFRDPRLMSPLTLAYIGDTVYDLYIRTYLVEHSDATAHGLHMQAVKRVCASAQAKAYHRIAAGLSEEEEGVFKRGRNSHLGTVPRNADISDYRAATGLEALLGYLYLSGRDARLNELMHSIFAEGDEPLPECTVRSLKKEEGEST